MKGFIHCSFFPLQVPEPEEEFVTPMRERLGLDQTQRGQAALVIRDAIRVDHGDFTIQVENTHGVATACCVVNVLGESLQRGHMTTAGLWSSVTLK